MKKSLTLAALITGAFSVGFLLITTCLLRRWKSEPAPDEDAALPPVTIFRPIKSGEVFPDLNDFLAPLAPDDQVIFGCGNDEDASALNALCAIHAGRDFQVVRCQPGLCTNPKINKLIQMEALARHELWIVLDSDVKPVSLTSFRRDWGDADAISAPYYWENSEGRISEWDAAGTSLSLWPGVALLRAQDRADFLLGACMGIRAQALKTCGGWSAFGDALADDHEIGAAIVRAGGRVRLASRAIPLRTEPMRGREWLEHQHRVFATYRRSNPAGFWGIPLTHGAAFSFFAALAIPRSVTLWGLHLLLLVLRMRAARSFPGKPNTRWTTLWMASVMEPIFWFSAAWTKTVRWNGTRIPEIAPCPNAEKV